MRIVGFRIGRQIRTSFCFHQWNQGFALKSGWKRQTQHTEKGWSDIHEPHSGRHAFTREQFARKLKQKRHSDGLVIKKNPVHGLAVSAQSLAMIGHHCN